MAADEWVVLRLRVQDRNRFIADTKASGMAVRELGNEARRTGGLFSQGAHHGFLWNQMLFTLRRTIYGLTLGLSAMAVAVAGVGFHFNSMIEQQTIAFTKMTGSAAAAKKEVTFLFNLAASGPFQFAQVIAGARQLMAFSYTAKQTNQVLTALQDAMAGMGLDQAQLDRATLALGEIRSIGVLQGRQVRQLEQLGLLNREVLAKGLGVSPLQVANVGQLHVPWQKAIDIITAYWRKRFKGAAVDFQKSWVGEISTIKDYGSQAFGYMVLPLQHRLERTIFPKVKSILQGVSHYYKNTPNPTFGGALGTVDKQTGTNLAGMWSRLAFVGHQVFSIFVSIQHVVAGAWAIFSIGGGPLQLIGGLLWGVSHALKMLAPILKYVIALWIVDRTVVGLATLATKANITWQAISVAWMKRVAFWKAVVVFWTNKETVATAFSMKGLRGWAFAGKEVFNRSKGMYTTAFANNGIFARFARTLFTRAVPALVVTGAAIRGAAAASWAFTASLLANPLTWIILGLVALGLALVMIIRHWKTVVHWMKEAWGWMKRLATAPEFSTGNPSKGKGFEWRPWKQSFWLGTGMATGGHVLTGGTAVVGEHGRELVTLPRGASVVPLGQTNAARMGDILGSVRNGILELTIPVYLDRRKIAESSASVDLDAMARA